MSFALHYYLSKTFYISNDITLFEATSCPNWTTYCKSILNHSPLLQSWNIHSLFIYLLLSTYHPNKFVSNSNVITSFSFFIFISSHFLLRIQYHQDKARASFHGTQLLTLICSNSPIAFYVSHMDTVPIMWKVLSGLDIHY